jgi:hypothetical protein
MSDARKKQSRAWSVWALVVVFVLYPLSWGPASWWAEPWCGGERWEIVHTVYSPLERLGSRVKWLRDPFDWYLSKWID